MTLRYIKVEFFPRKRITGGRGESLWAPDFSNGKIVRMGIMQDRMSRAEVRGNVEIEVYNARLPYDLDGIGPGAVVHWDNTDWDIVAPPAAHPTRTHSVRHHTVPIRRRPYHEGRRD